MLLVDIMKKKLKKSFDYCLFLDSSNYFLSIGISKNNVMIDKISYQCFHQQSKFLIVEINNLLKKNKILIKNLNALIITNGPGSYVGIRITVVIAKIFALVLKIPVYQISTLEANKILNKNSIVLFNARSNRSYIASFKNNNYLLKDQVMENSKIKKYIAKHKDFCLVGDLEYLGLIGKKVDILENMNIIFRKKKFVKNPDLIKPRYLN